MLLFWFFLRQEKVRKLGFGGGESGCYSFERQRMRKRLNRKELETRFI